MKNSNSLLLTVAFFAILFFVGITSAQILRVDSVSVDSTWNSDSSWYDGNGILQQRTSRDCKVSFVPQGEGEARMVIALSIDSGKTWAPSPNPLIVINNSLASMFITGQKATISVRVLGGDRPGVAFKMTARQAAPVIRGNPKNLELFCIPGQIIDTAYKIIQSSDTRDFCPIVKTYWDISADGTIDDSTFSPNASALTLHSQVPAGDSNQTIRTVARAMDRNGLWSLPETLSVLLNKTLTVSGTITRDTTWSTLGIETLIDGNLIINADVIWDRKIVVTIKDNASVKINGTGSLTIREGVRIKAGTGCYFEVGYVSAGALIVTGSDSLPVTFTKNTGVQTWGYPGDNGGGILLYNKATSLTSLEYCIVEYGTHGILVDDISTVIKNCKIRNNAGMGIHFSGTAAPKDSASFTGNELAFNGDYPISIEAEGVTKLSGGTVFTANGKLGIEVVTGDVTQSGTWRKHSIPYAITGGKIKIGKATSGVTITFAPGVICKCDVDSYFEIGYVNPGTVIAQGTDSDRIVFTTSKAGSYWGYNGGNIEGGLWIGTKATTNTAFSYCTIENSTNGIFCNEVKIAVSNCIIRNCQLSGIKFNGMGGPKDSASFVQNTITGNGEYAIEIYSSQLGALSGTGSVAGNTLGGILVNGDDVKTTSNIWKKHDAPYIIADKVNIGAATTGASVTIRPGARFLMATDAYIEVGYTNPGTIIAEGTATDSIKFTTVVPGIIWGYKGGNIEGGFWIGDKGTTNISFKYCDIGFAATGIFVRKAAISIKDCTIHDCSVNGITLEQYAPQTNISGITYANNGSDLVVTP